MFKSDKDLVVFDLEATGLKISEARIIAIGAIKIEPQSGKVIDHYERKVNPKCRITEEITEITGITNEDLIDQLPFVQIAPSLQEFMSDCDLAGYNLTRFDLPLLAEEFARAGYNDFPVTGTRVIDAQVIFHVNHPRTLSAALSVYCNEEHTAAHDAMGDTVATLKVLTEQLKVHDLPKDIDGLHQFSMRNKEMADWARLLYKDEDGRLRYNFGKHRDELVDDYPGYAEWMCQKDFPQSTINYLERYFEYTFDNDISF